MNKLRTIRTKSKAMQSISLEGTHFECRVPIHILHFPSAYSHHFTSTHSSFQHQLWAVRANAKRLADVKVFLTGNDLLQPGCENLDSTISIKSGRNSCSVVLSSPKKKQRQHTVTTRSYYSILCCKLSLQDQQAVSASLVTLQ